MLAVLTAALLSAGFLRNEYSGIAGLCGLFLFFGSGASLGYDMGHSRNAAAVGTLWAIWLWWMSLIVYFWFYPPLNT